MYAGAEQEGNERGRRARNTERADGRVVDVPQQKGVDGAVPVSGKPIPGRAIPPVGVKAAVGEKGEFGQDIELGRCECGGRDEKSELIGLEADF